MCIRDSAYLTTLGETLLPNLPVSLTSAVIMPYSLNAVTPNIATGFDLGVEVHGLVRDKFGYELGIFNGTGIAVNTATKTISDDWHIPSLLYAGRLTYMPKGVMPSTQGNPNRLKENKILLGISASMNVESENESTNDFRAGAEFALLKNRLYLAGEMYYTVSYTHLDVYKRQGIFRIRRCSIPKYPLFGNGLGNEKAFPGITSFLRSQSYLW